MSAFRLHWITNPDAQPVLINTVNWNPEHSRRLVRVLQLIKQCQQQLRCADLVETTDWTDTMSQ